jgi:hypothetical protein
MTDLKSVKQKYKEMQPQMGIFQLRNLRNGKVLVGSSRNLPGSINSLTFQLKHGLCRIEELQRDYTGLGAEQFDFSILDTLPPRDPPGYDPGEDLKELEKLWLDKLQPYGEKGYHKNKNA